MVHNICNASGIHFRSIVDRIAAIFVNAILALSAAAMLLSDSFAQGFGEGERTTVQRRFDPSFSIKPIVQRLNGRRGDVLHFDFEVVTRQATSVIDVTVVGLQQDLNGQITHVPSEFASEVVQLTEPGKIVLKQDEPHHIDGLVEVPRGEADFYSFGILVRDLGTETDRETPFSGASGSETRVGVRFVTQYVLRLDLDVIGARGELARNLKIKDGSVQSVRGLPQLHCLVENPTETAFEFEMRAFLRKSVSDRSFKPVGLSMPVRQSAEGPERYIGRVLPRSSVRMQSVLDEGLLSGDYTMVTELIIDGRVASRGEFPVTVSGKDFPAQEVLMKDVGGNVYALPSQLELGTSRGSQRRISFEIRNNSDITRSIKLKALNERDTPLAALSIQPSEFAISPGRSRRVSLSLARNPVVNAPIEFGRLVIESSTLESRDKASGDCLVALTYSELDPPNLAMEEPRWDNNNNTQVFRVTVHNRGTAHTPLNGLLTIESETGQRLTVPAGFGRWILPGESTDLSFPLPVNLTSGKHAITCEIQNGQNTIVNKMIVEVQTQPK